MEEAPPVASARPQRLQLDIDGMHCANCVVAVGRCLRKLPDVQSVSASYPPGRAILTSVGSLDLDRLKDALGAEAYTVSTVREVDETVATDKGLRKYLEIAAAFVILIGIALALQRFQLLPRGFNVSDQMSYGLIF